MKIYATDREGNRVRIVKIISDDTAVVFYLEDGLPGSIPWGDLSEISECSHWPLWVSSWKKENVFVAAQEASGKL